MSTSFCRYVHDTVIGSRRVRYTIWDTSGSVETNTSRSLAYREADVFLLCYNISDPSSLFSAINHWVPDLRLQAPATPIVLVGCQSDLRQSVTEVVSSPQALSMSQKIGAVMYVETSAKTSRRGVASVMEVAALTSLGQFSPLASLVKTPLPLPPSPPISKKHRQRSLSISRDWEGSLRSNSSTLSSTRSDVSMASLASKSSAASKPASPKVSINTCRTPKTERRQNRERDKEERDQEKMVMIKCQRLKADKTYEEVEIQVPAAVYQTMMIHSDPETVQQQQQQQQQALNEKKGLGLGLTNKIKCLFSKTDQ